MKKIIWVFIAFLSIVTCSMFACEHRHKYGEWELYKEPTCIEQGSYRRYCKECGVWEKNPIEPTGHTFETGETVYPSGSYGFRYTTKVCVNCKEEQKTDYVWTNQGQEISCKYYTSLDAYREDCRKDNNYHYNTAEHNVVVNIEGDRYFADNSIFIIPSTVDFIYFIGKENKIYYNVTIEAENRDRALTVIFENVKIESSKTIFKCERVSDCYMTIFGDECSFMITSTGTNGGAGTDKSISHWIGVEAENGQSGGSGADAFIVNGNVYVTTYCSLIIKGGRGGNGGKGGDVQMGVFGNGGNGGNGGRGGDSIDASGYCRIFSYGGNVLIEGGAGGYGGSGGIGRGIGVSDGSSGAQGQSGKSYGVEYIN